MSDSAKVKEHMEVRVGVFGASGVGKSCLIHRFITGQFKTESDPTVGVNYHTHETAINSSKLTFKLFDVSKQYKGIDSLVPASFSKISLDFAILVYDVMNQESLQEVEQALKSASLQNVTLVLVGNKVDLEYNSTVFQEADLVAKQHQVKHVQLSAKNAMGVNDLFYKLGSCVLKNHGRPNISPAADVTASPTSQHSSAGSQQVSNRQQISHATQYEPDRQYHARTVLLGDSAVGKSSILLRLAKNEFHAYQEPTIGAAFLTHTIALDVAQVRLEIWDTAGQERFRALVPMYYRGAKAAVIVYDITNYDSFKRAQYWVGEQHRYGSPGIVLALAGNKADLEDVRAVSYEEANDYAEENGLLFYETSAKLGRNISETFTRIAELVATKLVEDDTKRIAIEQEVVYNKERCCSIS